jgi:hypothetical protein
MEFARNQTGKLVCADTYMPKELYINHTHATIVKIRYILYDALKELPFQTWQWAQLPDR